MSNQTNKEYTKKDFEFMNSLGSAILEQSPTTLSRILKIWFASVLLFILWANYASIDEITRGDGKAIPYGQNKIIQNLEGGIIEKILIKEGDIIKKGDIILKIQNSKSLSTFKTNEIKENELISKRMRLLAESNQEDIKMIKTNNKKLKKQLEMSKKLFISRKLENKAKDIVLKEQTKQKESELEEAIEEIILLKKELLFVEEEIQMTEPMVKQGVKSKVDFINLKKEELKILQNINKTKSSLPRLRSYIQESENKRIESKQKFINQTREELNKVSSELSRIKIQKIKFSDQVNRTMVKSPVDGIVQKLYINTIGGVIKPGDNLIEIVPTDDKLYFEIKIKPSDIAFIHPGAEAKIKISAYDFAIHGGLTGTVVNISPDTITDKKDNTFYNIHIRTSKNYLGTKNKPLKIIPGMTANVDIITGKKTIIEYILKPILKSKDYVFTER